MATPGIWTFPDAKCTFEQPEICGSALLRQIACPVDNGTGYNRAKSVITNGVDLSDRSNWITSDHTYRNRTGHFLVLEQGSRINLLTVTKANSYLRVFYSSIMTRYVENIVFQITDASGTILFRDDRTYDSWQHLCVSLKDLSGATIYILFGAVDENGNLVETDSKHDVAAALALDDVRVSEVPCPCEFGCDFEHDCGYLVTTTSSDFEFHWKLSNDPSKQTYQLADATYDIIGKGHYMFVNTSYGQEGDTTTISASNFSTDGNAGCVSLNVFGTDINSGRLSVILDYNDGSKEERYLKFIDTNGRWFTEHVLFGSSLRQFHMVTTRGDDNGGLIAIDDIMILEDTKCIDGLADMGVCRFNHPGICHFGLNHTSGSRYNWKLTNPPSTDDATYPNHDADGDSYGLYMTVDSSYGGLGHTSYLWFDVNSLGLSYYQFWYYSHGGSSSKLYTTYDESNKMTELDTSVSDKWQKTDCFALPVQYNGRIYIIAEHGGELNEKIAIDNVNLTANCKAPSLECDFCLPDDCGYFGVNWTKDDNGWRSLGESKLFAPRLQIRGTQCLTFTYQIRVLHSFSKARLLVMINSQEVWFARGGQNFIEGEVTGQVSLSEGVNHISFLGEQGGDYLLIQTSLADGGCIALSCKDETEFSCGDHCLPISYRCDRKIDCITGRDEELEMCGYSLANNFTLTSVNSLLGYKENVHSSQPWIFVEDFPVVIQNESRTIKGLSTFFSSLTLHPSILESPEYLVIEPTACVSVEYLGDISKMTLRALYHDPSTNVVFEDEYFVQSFSWRSLTFPIPGGIFRLEVSVSMIQVTPQYGGPLPESAMFVIKEISIIPGSDCSDIDLNCPEDVPHRCLDNSLCFSEEQKCDTVENCKDASDESSAFCLNSISCTFEDMNMCGYRNLSASKVYFNVWNSKRYDQILWQRTPSSEMSRPMLDHTIGIVHQGHFLTSKNREGLHDTERLVDVETIESPTEILPEDGCITFWYYLNTTDVRPISLAAQIFVYLKYHDLSDKVELLWYDHINRPFPTWVEGGVKVLGNMNVSLTITAKTSIPVDTYTGVVSVDDIEYRPGSCMVTHPDCDSDMFQCGAICLPVYFVCDGEPDCDNGADEMHCDRPEGRYTLYGGDGSYGKLAYYYKNAWRPVCYPEYEAQQTDFNVYVAPYVCKQLGFSGNSESSSYLLWDKPMLYVTDIMCNEDGSCDVHNHTDGCETYAYIKCSHDVCFSGELLCPGSRNTCKPRSHFCDLHSDCAGRTDEQQCYCFEDESQCKHLKDECEDRVCETCTERSMFECMDHTCLPAVERCDGEIQCTDGLDEYSCVQIEDDSTVTLFDNAAQARETICVNSVTVELANHLCRLAGRGFFLDILRDYDIVDSGIVLTAGVIGKSLVPGYAIGERSNINSLTVSQCIDAVARRTLLKTVGLSRIGDFTDKCARSEGMSKMCIRIHVIMDERSITLNVGSITFRQCHPLRLQCQMPECGTTAQHDTVVQPFIMHGRPGSIEEWPWLGQLLIDGNPYCGAALISNNWALTAAHCLEDKFRTFSVKFGSSFKVERSETDQIIPVRETDHFLFDADKFGYLTRDIAVLELEYPVKVDNFTRPVCLGTDETLKRALSQSNPECYVTGFGQSEKLFNGDTSPTNLRHRRVKLIPWDICNSRWAPTEEGRELPRDVICVGSEVPHSPSCFGDSGGPLVCKNTLGRWEQLGVVSFGWRFCSHDLIPAVYASVPQYRDWIESTTGLKFSAGYGAKP